MTKIAFAIHGGAGNETKLIKENLPEYEESLKEAVLIGFNILKKGGSALTAVEEAVKYLEDNPLFNAGCGSALNNRGEVEMDASIMDGKRLRAGAVSMVRKVKNPISLARAVMTDTPHVMLSGYGALELAKEKGLPLEKKSYFVTQYQYDEYLGLNKSKPSDPPKKKAKTGTVGAVALDKRGNLASATSTGGTMYSLPGRIGDSCIIGAGCYANNNTCAISCTGDGELIITGVIAHTIAMLKELKGFSIQEACDYVIHKRNRLRKCQIGLVAVDNEGNIGVTFNSPVMKRAWISSEQPLTIKIY